MTKLIRSEPIRTDLHHTNASETKSHNRKPKRNQPLGADEPEDEADRGGDRWGADDAAGAAGRGAGHRAEGLRWRPAANH